MLNWIWSALLVLALVAGAFLGNMKAVTESSVSSAKAAVDIALGMVGQFALWIGLMRVLEDAGFLGILARWLRRPMRWLFPDVPAEHPAMSAMILNLAANMAGLTNAATPFGLRAMVELNKLNTRKGVATDAMCLFLAINTSGVAVLPLGVIATRAALGAKNISGITLPTILATACSTLAAIVVAKALVRLRAFAAERYASEESGAERQESAEAVAAIAKAQAQAAEVRPAVGWPRALVIFAVVALVVAGYVRGLLASPPASGLAAVRDLMEGWFLPLLMLAIVLFGLARHVKVYESLVAGGKESFQIAITIIPFMVAILVAIGMFRASGAMDLLVRALKPLTDLVGFPPEALPMALIRPLSGSGALAVLTDTMKTYGPDSFVGFLVSVINGSFETTFYVLALYFGSIQVRATRHTLLACLAADLTGVSMALVFSRIFWAPV